MPIGLRNDSEAPEQANNEDGDVELMMAANIAIQLKQPEQVHSLALSLAA